MDEDTEGYASEISIQLRDDLAHSVVSTSRRNDVLGSPSVIMPQLLRGAIPVIWVGVMTWIVVMSPSTMQKLSWIPFARRAKRLVSWWYKRHC